MEAIARLCTLLFTNALCSSPSAAAHGHEHLCCMEAIERLCVLLLSAASPIGLYKGRVN
jgi:hypothetical protein